MNTTTKLIGLAAIAAMCLSAPLAKANADYPLGVGNSSLSPTYPGPYGNVDVNLTSPTTAVITFTGGSAGGFSYIFGGAQAIDVNVNATSFTVTNLSPSATLQTPSSGNVSMFGVLNVTIDNFDGASAATTPMSFTLTNTGGTWASAAGVLTNNSSGYLAAAHIFVYSAQGVNVATGFAGNGGSTSVPDSGTVAGLLGAGLLALAALRRRFGLA